MSNYILNINKYRSTTTPQIVGRVADLPKLPIDVQVLDGDKPVDLTSAIVEFRGVTPTDKKIIVTSGITVTNKLTGSFTFTFPKNFYTSPGRFKRAYFVIKRGERLDSTQDLIIHVIESIDFDLDESEDIIEGLDQVIKEVTDKMNKETQTMVDEIQKEYDNLEVLLQKQAEDNITKIDREIKIAIDESKLRIRQLESEYRGIINNAQSTLNQLKAEVDKLKPYVDETNKKLDELNAKLKKIQDDLDKTNLLTKGELKEIKIGIRNYFSRHISNYNRSGTYMSIDMGSGTKSFSIFPKSDTPVGEMPSPSPYIGFTKNGKNADGGVIWGMSRGEIWNNERIVDDLNYLTVYPKTQEVLDWLHDNYTIVFREGYLNTSWTNAEEDVVTLMDYLDLKKEVDDLKKTITALGGS